MNHFRYFCKSSDTWGRLSSQIRAELRAQLVERDGLMCKQCEVRAYWLSIDHIIPISRGGPVMDIENLQLLCRKCHDKKTQSEQIR